MTSKEIYLDHAASTHMLEEVIELVGGINRQNYANAASIHKAGLQSNNIVKEATDTIAKILHTNPNNLVFTSGGAESNNLAIKSTILNGSLRKGNIVIYDLEHPTIKETAMYLTNYGYELRIIGADKEGSININEIENLVDDNTLLVSIAHVISENGALNDIKHASNIIKKMNHNTVFHVDAVQSLAKFNINLADMSNVDIMSFSSHKIHGPKGVGAVYIKNQSKMLPFIHGSKYTGLRAGTQNVSGIAAFAKALQITNAEMDTNYKHVNKLKMYLIDQLKSFGIDCLILSPKNSSPYILTTAFKDIRSEVLVNALSEKNIFVSAGSACKSADNKIPLLFKYMNTAKEYNNGMIRFSFSKTNTQAELDILLNVLKELIPMLQLFTRR